MWLPHIRFYRASKAHMFYGCWIDNLSSRQHAFVWGASPDPPECTGLNRFPQAENRDCYPHTKQIWLIKHKTIEISRLDSAIKTRCRKITEMGGINVCKSVTIAEYDGRRYTVALTSHFTSLWKAHGLFKYNMHICSLLCNSMVCFSSFTFFDILYQLAHAY